VRSSVDEGYADELVIHLAPLLLGAGTKLFDGSPRRELKQTEVRISPHATHLRYELGT
jgi:riboflavin biosynthesis pyrimidine reductase